ncbi:hypothetical protein PPTG_22020 [Phytophthora nicotianae INRA-310]|uniref:Helitron helicase-like domain-containing protein n=1 Tax=Phytophthora nicotianae (strain INRA-310) TaxID=761204 RepID=W2QNU8_PHYN3|nr:hypothetical protein PPTG_22020 [Phytophthora nicotianae INRA-310]ETN14852.1 hypothetical protein PPTG_22020 [Phytophthora nicotianae INRA-310]
MKNKPFDGLFGDVKAYFGMIETQGGGTLHAHFLIWLADAPPNSDAFNRAVGVYGDQYYRDIEAFTDIIVSTSMPLKTDGEDAAHEESLFCAWEVSVWVSTSQNCADIVLE